MTVARIVALTRRYSLINPAATQRQVHALTAELFTITTAKAGPAAQPHVNKRARLREATTSPTRSYLHESIGGHVRRLTSALSYRPVPFFRPPTIGSSRCCV